MIKQFITILIVLLISSSSFALDKKIEAALLIGDWESVYQLLYNDSTNKKPIHKYLLLKSSIATNRYMFWDESLENNTSSINSWSAWTTKLLRNNPNNPYALYLAADGEFFKRNSKKAIDLFKKAIKKKKDFALAYEGRAVAYIILGKHKKARSDCNKAIKLNPLLSAAYVVRGITNDILGEKKDALKDFNQALILIPNDVVTLNNRGLIYSNSEKYDSAILDFTTAISIDSLDIDSYNNRGLTYIKTGDYNKAITDFDKNIIQSNNLLAYIYKSYVYELQSKFTEAYETIKLAILSQGYKIENEIKDKPNEIDLPTLELKAIDGDSKAQFELSNHLFLNLNDNNFSIVFDLLQQSAQQDFPPAQASLGLFYVNGKWIPRDFEKSFFWFEKGALNGDTLAQFSLGKMYRKGDFVKQDYAKAIKWFYKAANQGMASASYNIGVYYQQGIIYEKSYEEAFKWFKKAALKGNILAQYNVGSYYEKGDGVKKNLQLAFIWYRLAAEKNDSDAQLKIGGFYALADVVPLDDLLASMWFLHSAVQGDKDAEKSLGIIQSQNSKTLNAKAIKMAKEWKSSLPHKF